MNAEYLKDFCVSKGFSKCRFGSVDVCRFTKSSRTETRSRNRQYPWGKSCFTASNKEIFDFDLHCGI
jgi:hypothetical protein